MDDGEKIGSVTEKKDCLGKKGKQNGNLEYFDWQQGRLTFRGRLNDQKSKRER